MRFILLTFFILLGGFVIAQDSLTMRVRDSVAVAHIDSIAKAAPDSSAMGHFIRAIRRTAKILSYLSYCDVRVGRATADYRIYECFKGKRIRTLDVQVLYPYGTNIDSPYTYHPTSAQRFANKMQIRTKAQVIRNELLFHEGDLLDPYMVADVERNLWERNIYKDIKIALEEVDSDMVDITIFVRDKWTVSFSSAVSYNFINGGIQLNNLFGVSQFVATDITYYFKDQPSYHVNAGYSYNNIRSTFINAGIGFSYDRDHLSIGVNVNRPFFSSKAVWAGRAAAGWSDAFIPQPLTSSPLYNGWTKSNTQDFWLARAFKPGGVLGKKFPLMRIITSARLQRIGFMSRPYFYDSTYAQGFINQTRMLGAIGFAHWDFYIDHDVYSLERGEYFAKGFSMALIGGFQDDEIMQRRCYAALAMQYGKAFSKAGYLLSYLKVGGFLTPQGVSQSLIDWQNTFYTINTKVGKAHMRHFLYTNIKMGFSRPSGQEIVADNNNGLRGVTSNSLRGNSTYGLSYEMDFYLIKKVMGFSASCFMFSDLSLVQHTFYQNTFQSGVGAGFRLRNLNLGLGFIEVSFAYYPHLEIAGQKAYSIMANSISNRTPQNRNLFSPDILTVD